MPLQNRVDPSGNIVSYAARGTMMGNRGGALHSDNQRIVRQHKGRRWITCLLEFRGRWRKVMSPGLYTELFFLDEAVALAAGHRPCAECRRERFNAFRLAWKLSHKLDARHTLPADEMDVELHRARIGEGGRKVTWESAINELPDGCFVMIDNSACLLWGDSLLLWSPEGYERKPGRPEGATVRVLTPRPTVDCIRQGYTPMVHVSATGS